MSTPRSRRWVAKLCRRTCTLTRLSRPAAAAARAGGRRRSATPAATPRLWTIRAMLVSAHDGGVDHHVFVVVIAGQEFENPLENAALGPSVEAR
jgi:hypothetical protein